MSITAREWFGIAHGMGLGFSVFLLLAIIWVELYNLRVTELNPAALQSRWLRLAVLSAVASCIAWVLVLFGTYGVYPMYRAVATEGADLSLYPRSFLLASATKSGWHKIGMEWKEHIGWFVPMLTTAATFIIWHYREHIAQDKNIRTIALTLIALAFITASWTGFLGAMVTKNAPLI